MSSLRSLKNRIKSVKSTEKLTNAMKTVATSKYNVLQGRYRDFEQYYKSCKSVLSRLASGINEEGQDALLPREEIKSGRNCYVLLTGNAGLCGSYNSDLLKYMNLLISEDGTGEKPLVIVCGDWGAARFKNTAADVLTDFRFDDIPSYAGSEKLALYLIELWQKGLAGSIRFVYQKYRNTLVHEPCTDLFLPFEVTGNDDEEVDRIYEPSKEEILSRAVMLCLKAQVYEKLLSAATGVQNATLTAMRSASENSEEMLALLELQMNRMRQASVTTEVIEVSGANANISEK